MRLYSTTANARSSSCPAARGRSRMYVCGPTVYQRAHIGNARPFVRRHVAARAGCALRGYEVTLVHNITDVNDKIYDAAPGRERRSWPREATEWYLEDTGGLGLGRRDR